MLGAAAALTYGGLGRGVAWAIRHGLCEVGGGRCPRRPADLADLPACPLRRSSRSQDFDVKVAFIKLGGGLGVQEVTKSDGSVTVTFTNSGGGGGVAGIGASFQVGHLQAGVGATAEAAVKFTAGRSWTFANRAAADGFVKRYGGDQDLGTHIINDARRTICFFCAALGWAPRKQPPADVTYTEGGLRLALGAHATMGWGAGLQAALTGAIGHSDERASGRRTAYLRLGGEASGEWFSAFGLGAVARATGIAALTFDRHDHPVALRLELVTSHAVTYQALPEGAGRLAKDMHGSGDLQEVEVDLDLADPASHAAAQAFLRGRLTGGPAAIAGRGADFARFVNEHGTTTVRTFASRDGHGGLGATLALGAEVGGGLSHSSQHLRLTGVYTRLPGLGFLPRADCLVR
ncbi:MAG: hypothetical protein JWN32_4110 [Solirubrobacterales bacterium]|nr:hypothetical protein [Solirubrobacterales bacterium]